MPSPFGMFQKPKPIGAPIDPAQQNAQAEQIQGFDPSWKQNLRTGFEGAVDTGLGALGVGPDTRMNRAGAMIPATMAMASMGNPMSGALSMPSGTPNFAGVQAPFKTGALKVQNISHLNQIPDIESYKQFTAGGMPHPEAVKAAAGSGPRSWQMGQNLDSMFDPNRNMILDEAGRPIAPKPRVDPSYQAHVASSRNKYKGR